jgi:hypothetical protein
VGILLIQMISTCRGRLGGGGVLDPEPDSVTQNEAFLKKSQTVTYLVNFQGGKDEEIGYLPENRKENF